MLGMEIYGWMATRSTGIFYYYSGLNEKKIKKGTGSCLLG